MQIAVEFLSLYIAKAIYKIRSQITQTGYDIIDTKKTRQGIL